MSQQQGAPPPPATRPGNAPVPPRRQTSAPDYLTPRVAFPAQAGGQSRARVMTRSGQSQGVGSRLARANTPRLLLALMALCTVAVVLFGTVATTALVSSAGAMQRASHNSAQLVRVQNIKAQILQADALATNAFLVGGLESAEARSAYDAAVADASQLLIEASEAQPADDAALQVVNAELVIYSASMAQARANNRQGFPVGASYLSQASLRLRDNVVPALDAMTVANTDRISSETSNRSLPAVILLAVVALAALGWTMRVVATRFKRRINVGLTASAGLVLVAAIVSVGVLAGVAGTVSGLESGALNGIRQLSAARTGGFDAKALESLTLVSRGSGQAYEEAWQQQSTSVSDSLGAASEPELLQTWQTHVASHEEIRALDDGGDWDGAVQAATQQGEGLSNDTAAAFQEQLAQVLDVDVVAADQGLLGLRTGLGIGAAVTVLLTLAGAGTALSGLQARRREYE